MIKTSSLEPINLQVNSSMFAERSWNLSFSLGKCVSKILSSRLREAAHDILKLSKAATTTSNHSLCHLQQLKIFLFSVCELKRRPKQKFPLNRTDLREDGGRVVELYHRGRCLRNILLGNVSFSLFHGTVGPIRMAANSGS